MSNKHEVIEAIAISIFPTGSRVICNPAPTDTDEDFVVLLKPSWKEEDVVDHLEYEGFDSDGDETYDILCDLGSGGWASYSRESVNYIITFSEEFYDRFVFATRVAKALNLLKKEDRKKLFQFILYKSDYDKDF